MKTEAADRREFLEVCDWDYFQYSGSHRKPNPPWRWFKVPVNFVQSPTWLSLTRQQRGDFIGILAAASQTGNMIPNDPNWLRSFGVSSKIAKKLSQLGLIRIFSLPADDHKIKELRRVFSGGTPTQGSGAEHGLNKGSGEEQSTGENNSPTPAPEINNFDPLARKVPIEDVAAGMTAAGAGKQKGAHDPRTFEDLKSALLPVAVKLGITDGEMIHRLAGQSLQMSARQISVAVKQLIEDGEL